MRAHHVGQSAPESKKELSRQVDMGTRQEDKNPSDEEFENCTLLRTLLTRARYVGKMSTNHQKQKIKPKICKNFKGNILKQLNRI